MKKILPIILIVILLIGVGFFIKARQDKIEEEKIEKTLIEPIVGGYNNGTAVYTIFGSKSLTDDTITKAFYATGTLTSATTTVLSGVDRYEQLSLNIKVLASSTTAVLKFVLEQSSDGDNYYSLATSTSVLQPSATTSLAVVPGSVEERNISIPITNELNTSFVRIKRPINTDADTTNNNAYLFIEAVLKDLY